MISETKLALYRHVQDSRELGAAEDFVEISKPKRPAETESDFVAIHLNPAHTASAEEIPTAAIQAQPVPREPTGVTIPAVPLREISKDLSIDEQIRRITNPYQAVIGRFQSEAPTSPRGSHVSVRV